MTDAERNEVWNEAMETAAREAESPRDGNERIAARIRDLKRYPPEFLCEHQAHEGDVCLVCQPCPYAVVDTTDCPACHQEHTAPEMASVENGLLPAPRLKQHEYGKEDRG